MRFPTTITLATGLAAAPAGGVELPHGRTGSGTSWLPDSTPMYAAHASAGEWRLMLHGALFAGWNAQGSDRGDGQLTVPNWVMGMAERPLGPTRLTLRTMLSAEPFTMPGDGYPLLLQTGETFRDRPLHDRQHPHDLFMEVAALIDIPLGESFGLQLYLAPAGESALGPTAFPHRVSALSDPLAPLGHHWQDATHISFGVLTAGLYTHAWKLEGSWFNGREPDEERLDFDLRVPDSFSGRFSVNPSKNLSVQASYGYLAGPEELAPDDPVHRLTASLTHNRPLHGGGNWASTYVLGVNAEAHHQTSSLLLESHLDLDGRNIVFGRLEGVQKTAGELVLPGGDPDEVHNIGGLGLGYLHAFPPLSGVVFGLGARGSLAYVSDEVGAFYGTQVPVGGMVFLQVRPIAAAPGAHEGHEAPQHEAPQQEAGHGGH